MAHKKAGGSTRNGRDSNPKYRRVHKYGGELVQPGEILVTQCGSKYHAGDGAYMGRNYTIHAKVSGRVVFKHMGPHKKHSICIEAA